MRQDNKKSRMIPQTKKLRFSWLCPFMASFFSASSRSSSFFRLRCSSVFEGGKRFNSPHHPILAIYFGQSEVGILSGISLQQYTH